jgi:16S rRNA (cytosine967-C5)-methyltransferase
LKSAKRNSKPSVSPARAAAFEILLQIARQNSYASELLHSRAYHDLLPVDHGLATELVMGTLRWRAAIDERIARASSQSLCKLDLEVLTSLRVGAYQLIYLDRIPTRAAVNESVELVKKARKHSAAPFVNAVLRKLARSSLAGASNESTFCSAADIAARFSHPVWMVERWVKNFGFHAAELICSHDQHPPETAIRVSSPAELAQIHRSGVELQPGQLLKSARRVRAGNIAALPAFRQGQISIQDEASQLVAIIAGSGKEILDCCAAPGGKTRILAEQNPGAGVVAIELHPHRARILRSLVKNSNVEVICADARSFPFAKQFDRVLADVPCSGTGTLARNPDIKWRLTPDDLLDLQGRQLAILLSAMEQTAPHGRLIYASCSLEPEENEMVIEAALATHADFQLLNCSDELARLRESDELAFTDLSTLVNGPYLRTIPGIHPCDGFFAAVLRKVS